MQRKRNRQRRSVEVHGALAYITLCNSERAVIDAADAEWASQFSWSANCGYAATRLPARDVWVTRKLHRMLLGVIDPSIQVDHIDGNRLNNRRSNLRLCTQKENVRNRGKLPSRRTRFIGVMPRASGSFQAYISQDGKRRCLGTFDCEFVAAHVRDLAAVRAHGEFARLNFPD
jgi:hypothetical protein